MSALEKAARAAYDVDGGIAEEWDSPEPVCVQVRSEYIAQARAVLMAVREPGNAAIAAGARVYAYDLAYEKHAAPNEGDEAEVVFTAMIDALLNEESE